LVQGSNPCRLTKWL